jgi:hypothetical protein
MTDIVARLRFAAKWPDTPPDFSMPNLMNSAADEIEHLRFALVDIGKHSLEPPAFAATTIAVRYMTDIKDGPCFYCGKRTSRIAGDPGQWPLIFCQPDGTGFVRYHHTRCVVDRLPDVKPTSQKAAVVADTIRLCEELVRMAAFVENKKIQQKIYKTVHQLQLLDQLAKDQS